MSRIPESSPGLGDQGGEQLLAAIGAQIHLDRALALVEARPEHALTPSSVTGQRLRSRPPPIVVEADHVRARAGPASCRRAARRRTPSPRPLAVRPGFRSLALLQARTPTNCQSSTCSGGSPVPRSAWTMARRSASVASRPLERPRRRDTVSSVLRTSPSKTGAECVTAAPGDDRRQRGKRPRGMRRGDRDRLAAVDQAPAVGAGAAVAVGHRDVERQPGELGRGGHRVAALDRMHRAWLERRCALTRPARGAPRSPSREPPPAARSSSSSLEISSKLVRVARLPHRRRAAGSSGSGRSRARARRAGCSVWIRSTARPEALPSGRGRFCFSATISVRGPQGVAAKDRAQQDEATVEEVAEHPLGRHGGLPDRDVADQVRMDRARPSRPGHPLAQGRVERQQQPVAGDRLVDRGVPPGQRQPGRVEDLAALEVLEVGATDGDPPAAASTTTLLRSLRRIETNPGHMLVPE